MSEALFTRGPWQVSGVRHKWREVYSDQLLDSHVVGRDGDGVCLVFHVPKYHAEQLANARLISAAPEMYEKLKETAEALNAARLVMTDKEARDLAGEIVDAARSVLAKAVLK